MHTRLLLAASLLASASALAVPMELTHQGRLLDSTGTPLDGGHDLTFTLSDAPTGGTVVWSETSTLNFDGGFYSAALGADSSNPLDLDAFDADELYLAIAVDGGSDVGDRQRLRSTPYALRAGVADGVSGGVVDATEILINGNSVIGTDGSVAWSSLSGVPDGLDTTLGSLTGCSDGDVASWSGSAWSCAGTTSHTHNADDITDGVLAIDRLPVGGGADQVSAGNHAHDLGALTGTIGASQVSFTAADIGGLADDTTAADIGGLADDTTAADIGGLSIDGGTLTGALTIEDQLNVDTRIVSQGGQVHRDFATFSTTANNGTPIHIKTNVKIKTNTMYRFLVEGYNYGIAQPINSETVGYTYSQWACVGNDRNINHSPGVSISTYCSADDYVVVKLSASSFYFAGMGISGWFTNPAGKAFDIEATQIVQQSNNL